MRIYPQFPKISLLIVMVVGVLLMTATPARAHCDTEDGPVVSDAKVALASGDVTPVLKWVRPVDESEVRAAFAGALAVRGKGDAARELADKWFFETLVRVHRAGEGAPYTGLKPAGTPVDPAVRLSDRALETGSVDSLVNGLTSHLIEGVRERFRKASELREHAGDSVEAGRAYVAAYVEFVHYAERLHQAVVTSAHAHGEGQVSAGTPSEHAH
jgi:hypothetical protein